MVTWENQCDLPYIVRRYAKSDMILILILFLNSKHKLYKYRKDLYEHNSLEQIS